ncbi:MAG: autotransporter-associated beta strand repeat-containing protein [Opitutales bacterium]
MRIPARKHFVRALLVAAGVSLSPKSGAATLYWDGGTSDIVANGDGLSSGGDGTWSDILLNWDAGLDVPEVALTGTDDAVLGGTGGTVSLGSAVSANSLTFASTGYTLTGGAGAYGLTLNGGGLTANFSAQIDAAIALGAAQTWTVDSGATLTQNGALSGAFLLTKAGAGTLALNAATGHTGGTTINAGTLQFATGALGASGSITMGGGTLKWAAGNTSDISSRLVLTSLTTATLDTGANNVTFASALGPVTSANVVKEGAGMLTLNAASTFTGTLTVAGGTVKQGVASAVASASSIAIGAGASFDTSGLAGLSGKTVTIAGTGVAGATGIRAAALYNSTNTGAAFGNITLTGDATIAAAGGGSSSAAPSRSNLGSVNLGGYTLTLIGTSATTPGFFSLTSPQFTNGNVIARDGAVLYGANAALITNGTAATLTLKSGGYLNFRDLNSSATTNLVSIVLDGGTLASAGTVNGLWLDNSATNGGGGGISNLPNPITVSSGGGTFLSNNSAFGIDINLLGALSGSGSVTVTGNRNIVVKGDASGYTGSLTSSGGTALIFNPSAATQIFAGNLAGASGLTKQGVNSTTLSGASTMTGATRVERGTLVLDYSTNNNQKATGGSLSLASSGPAGIELVGGSGYTETFTGTTLANASINTLNRSSGSNLLDLKTVTANTGAINLLAEGFLKVDNANDANGYLGVWVSFGNTAQLATKNGSGVVVAAASTDIARLGTGTQVLTGTATSNLRLIEGSDSAANFTLDNATNSINSLAQSASGGASTATVDLANRTLGINYVLVGTGAGALTIGTAANSGVIKSTGTALAFRDHAAAGITVNSAIADGTGASSLTKLDLGTLTLTAQNSYTGTTTVGTGTLAITGSGQLGMGGYAGAITNASAITFSSSAQQRLSGVISGAGTLTKNTGTGILNLTGANTYTGATTISTGTLQVGDTTSTASTLGNNSAAAIASGATLVFYRGTGAYAYGGVLSGAGNVRFHGNGGSLAGDYSLSATMTMTGSVTLSGARLIVDNLNDVTTASGITVNAGGGLYLSGAVALNKSLTLAGYGWNETSGYLGAVRLDSTSSLTSGVTLAANARIGTWASAANTVSGAISGTGGLDVFSQNNTKVLTISTANTYSGITTVNQAKLLATNTLQNTSSVYVGSTGIAEFQGVNTFTALTTAVAYNRILTADGGQIILGAAAGGRIGNITLSNGGTLTSNQTVAGTADWTIANTGMGAAQVTVANTGANTSAATLASGVANSGVHLNGNVTFNVADVTASTTSDLNVNLILANFASSVLDGSTAYTSGALTKRGAGTMTLNAANTYAGTTTILNGTVALSTASGAIASSATISMSGGSTLLLNNTAAANNGNRLGNSTAVNLNGATLNFANDAGAASFSETAGVLTIGGGQNTVTVGQAATGQTTTLTFASMSRSSGAVNFAINGGTAITGTANTRANIVLTTPFTTSNGILGTWATVNQADWATMSGSSIVAYTGYTDATAAGSTITGTSATNLRVTGAGTSGAISLGTTTALNTLLMAEGTTAATLDTATKTLSIAGIYAGTGRAALTLGSAVGDGLLQASSAGGTLMIGSDSANGITVNAVIQNNTSSSGLLKYGTGLVTLAGANTFGGAVNMVAGTLRIANTSGLGSGSLTLAGGTLQLATDSAVASRAVTLAGNASIVLDRATAGAGYTTSFSTLTFNESYTLSVSKGANVTSGTPNLTFTGLVQLGGTQGRVAGFDVGAGTEVSLTAGNTGTGVFASIEKSGAGTLIMSGSYTYWDPAGNSGRIAVNAGTLDLRGSTVLGDGTNGANSIGVALAAATTVKFATDTALGNYPWIQATGDGATVTMDRSTAGAGIANTFQGLDVRGAYTVNFTGGANITSGTNQINFTTGTLWGNTTLNISNPAAGTNVVNFSSAISDVMGPRSLTKTGTGTLQLSAANNLSGGIILSAGQLNINHASALGPMVNKLTINGGTINNTSGGAITVANDNIQTWGGAFTFAGSNALNLGNGVVTLSANSTVTVSASTLTVGGQIYGGFGLTKDGAGTLTLSGASGLASTYSGGLTLSAGTLNLNNNTAAGATAGTLTLAGGTLDNTSGVAVTLINNNAQSWSGDFAFTGTNALNLGTGAVALGASRTVTVNASTLTVGGVISGSGFSLTKAGAGTLALNGANSFTGGVNVNAGTLLAGATGAINGKGTLNGGNLLIAQGVALSIDGGLTFASNTAATLAAQGGLASIYGWDVNTADIIVNTGINGSIASSVSVGTGTYGVRFDVNGTGTLTVSGAVTGTGNVGGGTVNNGTLVGTDTTALFKLGDGDLTLTGAGTFTAGSNVASTSIQAGRLILSGGDNRLPSGSAVYLGATTNTSGKLVLGGISQSVTGLATVGTGAANAVVGGSGVLSTLTVTNANNYTFAGALGGAGTNENNLAFVKSGSGTLTLTGTSTLLGGTTVSAGTLQIGAGGTAGLFSGAITNNATLIFNRSDASEFSGVIGGTGALTKQGNGTLTLSGLSNYSGVTTVSGGAIAVTNDANLGAAPGSATAGQLVLDGGTLSATAGFTLSANRGISLGASGGTIQVAAGQTLAYGGVLAGDALTKSGDGVLSLSGTSTHTGATNVSAGTLQLGSGASISGSAVSVASGATLAGAGAAGATTVASGGALTAGLSGVGTLTLSGLTFSGNATVTLGASSAGLGSYLTVNGDVLASGSADSVIFALGSGLASLAEGKYSVLRYSGAELTDITAFDWSGTKGGRQTVGFYHLTELTDGYRAVQLDVQNAFPVWVGSTEVGGGNWGYNDTNWKLNTDDSTTDFRTTDTVLFDDDGQVGAIDIVADVDPSSITFTANTVAYTIGSVGGFKITSGSLLKSGNASLTLTSENSFAGGTRLAAGTLRIGHDAALGTGTLELAGGKLTSDGTTARSLANALLVSADVTLGDATDSGALAFSGAVDLGGATRTLTVASATTLAGAVGNGGLTKAGNATLVLSGTNSYGDGTAVSAGILQVGDGGTSGSIAGNVSVTNGASLAFNRSDNLTYTGVVSGQGSLTKLGGGTLSLTGANIHTGGTTISAGTLQVGDGGIVGSLAGNVSVANGATFAFSRSDNVTYAGTVTGEGALAKLGSGALALTGTNDFTGGVTLSAGTLRIGSAAALGSGTLSANAGTISSDSTTARSVANNVVIGGDLTLGDLVNTGALTFSGNVDLGAGTRQLTLVKDVTLSGAVSNGSITKLGAAALTLSGDNTLAGGVTLTAGTLNLGSATALGDTAGTFTVNGGTLNNTSGASLTLTTNNAQSWAGNFTFTGTHSLDLGTGAVSLTAARTVTVSASTLTVGGNVTGAYALTKAGAGTLALNGSVANNVVVSAGTLTASGAIGGTFTLSAGTATLASTSTVTGLTTLTTGTLTSAGSLAGGVTVSAGTLTSSGSLAGGGSVASGATLDSSGAITGNIANAGTLRFSGESNRTYAGNLTGAGALVKTGAGNLTLTGSNAAGSLALQGGTVTLSSANALGSIPVTFSAGTTLASTLNATISGTLTFSGAASVDVASGTTLTASGSWALSNTLTKVGAGTLKLATGYYTSSSSSAASDFVVNAGTLEFSTGNWTGNAFSGNNTLNITVNAGGTLRTSASHAYGGSNLNNAINVITLAGGTMTVDGGHYLPSGTVSSRGRLILDGGTVNGSAEITGSNGTITINSLANANTSTISNSGGLRLNYGNVTFDVADGAAAVDLLVSNVVSGGSYGVTKNGAGLLQFGSANTYGTGTSLNAGTLSVSNLADGANSSIGTGGLTIAGGTLQYTGTGAQSTSRAFSVTGAATFDLTSATGELTFAATNGIAKSLTKTGNGRLNLNNAISGATTAIAVNGGTLALGGANTYAGGTTVTAGTLLATAAGTLGSAQISISGGAVDFGGFAFDNAIYFTGGTLTNATGLTGAIEVAGGTLTLGTLGAYGSGAITVSAGGTFDLNFLNPTGTINLDGGQLINAGNWNTGSVNITSSYTAEQINALAVPNVTISSGTINLSGVTRDVTVDGGTVTGLTGYSGDITVTAGTVDLSSGEPASGTLSILGGTVNFGDRASDIGITYGSGTISGANYTGTITVQGTNVTLGAGIAAGTVAVGEGTSVTIQSGFDRDLLYTGGTLGGLGNYDGNLTVQGATLDLGTASNPTVTTATIILAEGGELAGQGNVGSVVVQAGGVLAPGNSPGLINATDLALNPGGIGQFQVYSITGTGDLGGGGVLAAGIDYDSTNVTGVLDLSALTASSQFNMFLISLSGPNTQGSIESWDSSTMAYTFDLFTYATLYLGDNEAMRGGDLTSLFNINTAGFVDEWGAVIKPEHFTFTDTGSSIQLTYSVVPEPSTYGLMLGGLALAVAAVRRRRAKSAAGADKA